MNIYNLSQDEIDQLVQETIGLANQMQEPRQLTFGIDPNDYNIFKGTTFPNKKSPEILKKECDHDWKIYLGLNQTDTYCTKCNITK
jgi:hypothetical protein